ncbi:MAG: FG-GAP repeat protein, partial [Planctomycetes bacterium]|nr:FG-GAP repeat protein [Planctomycetota bacterium]
YDSGRLLNVGRVVILSGKDGSTLQTYVGASDNKLGKSVASANDVKSDATTGFAMQAITPGPSVRVHVHRSLPSPFTRILRLKSGSQPQQFGHAVDGGFDFDADGVRDFVTGSPFDSLAAKSGGGVTFFSGATGNPVHVIHGAIANGELGASLACIDDLDGDGHGDLVVGAAAILDQSQKGAVLAFSGRTGAKLYRIEGHNAGDAFGFRVTAILDIDHDGFDDWAAIPAFGDYAELRSGRDGSLIHMLRPPLGKTYGISGGGDIDADGVADVLVTTLFNTTRFNYVYAYSGRTGVLLQTHAGSSDDDFGRSTAILGDIDDDGHADYVIGVRYGGHVYSGRAEFISGKTGSTIDTLHGSFLRDGFGYPIRAIGDANGNGTPDVAIAAMGGSTTGYVRVFDGATLQLISTSAGLEQGLFGNSVGAAGDLDDDGCLDLIIGAPFSAGSKGSIYVNSEPTVASRPRSYVFGHGCLSAGNTMPRIGIEGRAAIGTTMTMTVRGVPRSTAALFRLGFQKADIDLGIIGMPNCRAYVLPIVDFGLATTTDRTAEFALPVRNETRFVGAELFFQWFALDSKANALGIIASDAMRTVIGLQ